MLPLEAAVLDELLDEVRHQRGDDAPEVAPLAVLLVEEPVFRRVRSKLRVLRDLRPHAVHGELGPRRNPQGLDVLLLEALLLVVQQGHQVRQMALLLPRKEVLLMKQEVKNQINGTYIDVAHKLVQAVLGFVSLQELRRHVVVILGGDAFVVLAVHTGHR